MCYNVSVHRAYKYRFYPTQEQESLLKRTLGCCRYLYNYFLRERTDAFYERGERIGYHETSKMLTALKKDPGHAWLNEVSAVPLQNALRHLQDAFVAFWEKRSGYPSFKSKHRGREAAKFGAAAFTFDGDNLWLAKMNEPLDIRWSRALPEGVYPTSITVSLDPAGRWFVIILVDEDIKPLPDAPNEAVGVDAGITSLFTLSTGEKVNNPRHEKRYRERLAKAQRRLAKKQKGSANREKARRKVARIHARIADCRHDHLHKLSTRLVRENQTVVVEDLNVRGMLKNHSLARAIADASWSEFRRQLEYKAAWYGRTLVAIDRFHPSSKRCSACGHVVDKLPLDIREWVCPECGTCHDRDVNAARNIEAAGLAVTACGGGVRPRREFLPSRQPPAKQENSTATPRIPLP